MKRLILVGFVVLAGCQTRQISEMSYSETKALAGEIVQRCIDQGVKPNSQEMRLCTQQEVYRENSMRVNNRAMVRRGAAAIGAGLQNASQGYYRAASRPSYNQSVTCTNVAAPAGYAKVRCY